jgi:hypothetical protein
MSLIVPDPREREVLHFWIARQMSYRTRMISVFLLIVAGILLEVFLPFPAAFVGVLPLLLAGLMMAAAGYSNAPRKSAQEGFWKTTDITRLDSMAEIARRSSAWDTSSLDISNPLGCFTFIPVVGVTAFLALVAEELMNGGMLLLPASSAALFLPIWLTGLRLAHSNKAMLQKVRVLQDVVRFYQNHRREDEIVELSILLKGAEKDAVPEDVKLQIRWKGADPGFHGLQCQVNLNDVQGRLYPYCYFVVVTKREFDVAFAASGLALQNQITVEVKRQSDVNVVIVRQHTTNKSGYHTKPHAYLELMQRALRAGRKIADRYPAAG